MKRILCIFLGCLMLSACGKQSEPAPTEPPYEAQQPTVSPTEPSDPEAILAYRRDVVEAEMRRCMSTLWSPAQDITYLVSDDDAPETAITMYADRIYQGLPYTHGSSSVYNFLSYATSQDENGVYTVTGLESIDLTGSVNSRQGCDCADTLFWAWAQVSNSIQFRYTAEMTEAYGIVKVGSYVCNLPKFTGSTKPICTDNGEDVMFDAYSKLQKGDGMVLYTKSAGGHAVMVVDSVVQYTEDGKIDADASYVVIIEQTTGPQREEQCYYNEDIGQTVYICGAVDSVWSYSDIFKKGYLPVTCKELVDPSPLPEQSVEVTGTCETIDDLYKLNILSSHRIASVTVTITQKNRVVQKATAYGTEDHYTGFPLLNFFNFLEKELILGSFDPEALAAGKYHCAVTCRLSTGNVHTVHEFDFRK